MRNAMTGSFYRTFRSGDPIGNAAAARLFNRLGLGGSREEVEHLATLGAEAAVVELLPGGGSSAIAPAIRPFRTTMLPAAQAWWLGEMLEQPDGVRERMTLFWHGHFACTVKKPIHLGAMVVQNEVFRGLGLGEFGELVQEVVHGVAMQRMLDGPRNRRGMPNENLAREVLELFCLGIGNYVPEDVRELARALTGWDTRHQELRFDAEQHDDGEKVLLGKRGRFTSKGALDVVVRSRACARFLVRTLTTHLVGARPSLDEEGRLINDLIDDRLHIGRFMARVASSEALLGEGVFRPRVAAPAVLAVSLVRRLGLCMDPSSLSELVGRAGQSLFAPPGVDGWPYDSDWTTSTWSLRRAELPFLLLSRCDPESLPSALSREDPSDWLALRLGVDAESAQWMKAAGARFQSRGVRGTDCAARILALPRSQQI